MSQLNKYSFYNYNFNNSFDKTVELIQMFNISSYDEVLNYIVDKYGDFSLDTKVIDFPEASKTLNLKLDKNSNILEVKLLKDGEIIKACGCSLMKI